MIMNYVLCDVLLYLSHESSTHQQLVTNYRGVCHGFQSRGKDPTCTDSTPTHSSTIRKKEEKEREEERKEGNFYRRKQVPSWK